MGAVKAGQRDYFWDAARALLMLLGIPFHVALAYQAGQEWIVASREGEPFFTDLQLFIHLFRMPAFFVIAGYFAALLLTRREPAIWLRGRMMRLGVPMMATLLILVPPLNLVAELSNLAPAAAIDSWKHSSMTSGGYWVRHLWFIIVLLYCSAAAAAVARWRPALRTAMLASRIDGWIARYFPFALLGLAVVVGLWEAVAVELFYKAGLATNLPQQVLRIDELITYAPYFALGCLLQRAPVTLDRVKRPSVAMIAVALISTIAYLIYRDQFWAPVGRFVGTFAAVAITQMVIAGTKRFLDRPIPLVQRLVAASFVIYLVHVPIIVLLIWLGQFVAVSVWVKAVAVMLLAFTLSYGVWLVVERLPLLSFLFNGVTPVSGQRTVRPVLRYLPSNR